MYHAHKCCTTAQPTCGSLAGFYVQNVAKIDFFFATDDTIFIIKKEEKNKEKKEMKINFLVTQKSILCVQ